MGLVSGHAACPVETKVSCPEHQQSRKQVSVHAAHQPASTREIQCDASAAAPLQLPLLLCMEGPKHCQGLPVCFAGKAEPLVTEAETWIMFVVWWVGLGVLSSVGLGTGIHTGLLFLFPHIFKVSDAAASVASVIA